MDEFDSKLCLFSNYEYINKVIKDKFNNEFVSVSVTHNFKIDQKDLQGYDYYLINLININLELLPDIYNLVLGIHKKCILLVDHSHSSTSMNKVTKFINDLFKINKNVGVILVPELLGEEINYNKSYLTHNLILQSLLGGRVVIDETKRIFPISVEKLIETVVKQMLSFGVNGKKLLVTGYDYSTKFFVNKLLHVPEANIVNRKSQENVEQIMPDLKHTVRLSMKNLISKTISYMKDKNIIEPEIKILDPKKTVTKIATSINKKNKIKKLIFNIFIFLVVLVLFPLFSILVSGALAYVGAKQIVQNPVQSKKIMSVAKNISQVTYKFNLGIKFYEDCSLLAYHFLTIVDRAGDLAVVGRELSLRIMGDRPYELNNFTSDISASLDRLYYDLSFIQSDIDNMNSFVGKELRTFLKANNLEFSELKQKIYQFKKLTSRIADILGMESSKKYLILFQNNMELRPTGGFIGSYALLTFDKGMLSSMVVNDIYSADGQLKGHVEPPDPIRIYLGEGGWYLRDSNWDPDFKNSALKAKWFLDKEIDEKVDGVVAIDLYFIQNLLDVIGPVNLVDFNTVVTSKNLYELTQSQVESDFFPGSIKKSSFLTSLSRVIMDEVKNLERNKYLQLFKSIAKSLEEKHIQIYFDDINAQNATTQMGYAGGINFEYQCGERCYADSVALIDANLGVNKSNYFIKRSYNLSVKPEQERISRSLLVTYENSAGLLVGDSGIYQNYARLLIPSDVFIQGVRIYNSQNDYSDLNFDSTDFEGYKEIGFYFEVKPQTNTRVQIDWYTTTQKLTNGGEYKLYVRKQAGTDSDNLQINIETNELSLTGEANYRYNYVLVKDLVNKWFFKPK